MTLAFFELRRWSLTIAVGLLGLAGLVGVTSADVLAPGTVTRFGNWLLVRPTSAQAAVTVDEHLAQIHMGRDDEELYLYYGDGSRRALMLRFRHGGERDSVVMKSGVFSTYQNACRAGLPTSLRTLDSVRGSKQPLPANLTEFADDQILRIDASERGLHRVGEQLVMDLSRVRLNIEADSPTVHIGDSKSGEFCRYESDADPRASED